MERLFDSLRLNMIVSLDGASKETYEAIRVGADFDRVMANLRWFRDRTAEIGTSLTINFCLMPQNHHELVDVLRLGDDLDVHVNVLPVRGPSTCSIVRMDKAGRLRVFERLLADDQRASRQLGRNHTNWTTALAASRSWSELEDGSPLQQSHKILMFPRRRDQSGVSSPLSGVDMESRLGQLVINTDEVVSACDESVATAIGVGKDTIIGRKAQSLYELFDQVEEVTTTGGDPDYAEFLLSRSGSRFRLILVPSRDQDGQCSEVVAALIETST